MRIHAGRLMRPARSGSDENPEGFERGVELGDALVVAGLSLGASAATLAASRLGLGASVGLGGFAVVAISTLAAGGGPRGVARLAGNGVPGPEQSTLFEAITLGALAAFVASLALGKVVALPRLALLANWAMTLAAAALLQKMTRRTAPTAEPAARSAEFRGRSVLVLGPKGRSCAPLVAALRAGGAGANRSEGFRPREPPRWPRSGPSSSSSSRTRSAAAIRPTESARRPTPRSGPASAPSSWSVRARGSDLSTLSERVVRGAVAADPFAVDSGADRRPRDRRPSRPQAPADRGARRRRPALPDARRRARGRLRAALGRAGWNPRPDHFTVRSLFLLRERLQLQVGETGPPAPRCSRGVAGRSART